MILKKRKIGTIFLKKRIIPIYKKNEILKILLAYSVFKAELL